MTRKQLLEIRINELDALKRALTPDEEQELENVAYALLVLEHESGIDWNVLCDTLSYAT